MANTPHPHLNAEIRSTTGIITLDRQRALNALSEEMCESMIGTLGEWAESPGVDRVMITAAPGRAFCAGGDIRALAPRLADNPEEGDRYFRIEYSLDTLIHAYPKPVVVLANGLTMGGGAGLLLNASHPVITTAMDFAMPETGIGLFPDAGASLFLRRAPSAMAAFLGMTGWRIGAGDMLRLGIAPLAVEEARAPAVADAVVGAPDASSIGAVLEEFRTEPAEAPLADAEEQVTRHFSGSDPVSIRAGLEGDDHPAAELTRQALDTRCPLSITLTHRLLTDPGLAPADAVEALEQDYRIATRMLRRPDFGEGIRAALIDKDNSPNWRPGSLDGVTPDMVDAIVGIDGAVRLEPVSSLSEEPQGRHRCA